MALKTINLLGQERDKVKIAIERIQFAWSLAKASEREHLYVAFSGGKDSIVIAHLCKLADVPFTLNYNITGIDPPELIYFMREYYPELNWSKPDKTMWQLIVKNMVPPLRQIRYCCRELKERGGINEYCVTGVRWAESTRRASTRAAFERFGKERMLFNDNVEGRKSFEFCQLKSKFAINPIIDWSDSEVWEFIRLYELPYCCLYDEGFSRLGCIGCPMVSPTRRKMDLKRYPGFERLYIRAFEQMIKARLAAGKSAAWKDAEHVMAWWLKDASVKKDGDEGGLF